VFFAENLSRLRRLLLEKGFPAAARRTLHFWFDSRRTLLITHVHVFVAQAAYVIPFITNEYAGYTRDCFWAAHITARIIVIAWRAHKSILDPMAWSDHATYEALAVRVTGVANRFAGEPRNMRKYAPSRLGCSPWTKHQRQRHEFLWNRSM